MLSLDPHDEFGNKHPQASSPDVSDLWLSIWFNGDQGFCSCGAEINNIVNKSRYEENFIKYYDKRRKLLQN